MLIGYVTEGPDPSVLIGLPEPGGPVVGVHSLSLLSAKLLAIELRSMLKAIERQHGPIVVPQETWRRLHMHPEDW